jgi:hypothetical protein
MTDQDCITECFCCLEPVSAGLRMAHACVRCWKAYSPEWPGSKPNIGPPRIYSPDWIPEGRAFFAAKGIELRRKASVGMIDPQGTGLYLTQCPCCDCRLDPSRFMYYFACNDCFNAHQGRRPMDANDAINPQRMRAWFRDQGVAMRAVSNEAAQLAATFRAMAQADPELHKQMLKPQEPAQRQPDPTRSIRFNDVQWGDF